MFIGKRDLNYRGSFEPWHHCGNVSIDRWSYKITEQQIDQHKTKPFCFMGKGKDDPFIFDRSSKLPFVSSLSYFQLYMCVYIFTYIFACSCSALDPIDRSLSLDRCKTTKCSLKIDFYVGRWMYQRRVYKGFADETFYYLY